MNTKLSLNNVHKHVCRRSYILTLLTLVMKLDLTVVMKLDWGKVMGVCEYGSTLYVGLARALSPTNTNFRLTFLLTRPQEALYEDLAV